jgi:hypothetical protein
MTEKSFWCVKIGEGYSFGNKKEAPVTRSFCDGHLKIEVARARRKAVAVQQTAERVRQSFVRSLRMG